MCLFVDRIKFRCDFFPNIDLLTFRHSCFSKILLIYICRPWQVVFLLDHVLENLIAIR